MLIVYAYATCSTCRKAKSWLDRRGIAYEERAIREQPPTVSELRRVLTANGGEIRRLFNTSGDEYRRLAIKDQLPTLSVDQALKLLAGNGNLIKRPLAITADGGLVGFDEAAWQRALG